MTSSFRFKQFSLSDENSAMKLTTDAVVLGALAIPYKSGKILDIGAGCGILSLMMAQKSQNTIDAIEIEPSGANQSLQNFQNSPWNHRLNIYCISLKDFVAGNTVKYHTIICNPPYYNKQFLCDSYSENLAKHSAEFSIEELFHAISLLLHHEGVFWTICPYQTSPTFIKSAWNNNLYVKKIVHLFNSPEEKAIRTILCFSYDDKRIPVTENLFIRNADGSYTDDFKRLTEDFYLW